MEHRQFRRNEVVEPVDPRVFQRYVVDRLLGATITTYFFTCNSLA